MPVNWRGETPREEMQRKNGIALRPAEATQPKRQMWGDSRDRQNLPLLYLSYDASARTRRTGFAVRFEQSLGLFPKSLALVRYVDEVNVGTARAQAVFKEDTLKWTGKEWQVQETLELTTPTPQPSRYFRNGKFTINMAALLKQSPKNVATILGKSKAYSATKTTVPNGREIITSELCVYGDRDREIVNVFYIDKKSHGVSMMVQAGVAPHAVTPEQIGKALGIKKMRPILSGDVKGVVLGVDAQNVKPYGNVQITSSMDEDGFSRCTINMRVPEAERGRQR